MQNGNTLTLGKFIETSSGHDRNKAEVLGRLRETYFNTVDNRMCIMATDIESGMSFVKAPTDWAMTQVCSKLGPSHFGKGSTRTLPLDYINNWPVIERAQVLNMHLDRVAPAQGGDDKEWLLRMYGDTCRAVLSGNYPIVNNTDLLLSVQDAISDERMGGMNLAKKSFIDADKMHLYVSWHETGADDGGGGTYALGSYVSNDEIGKGAIHIWPFVKRTSCDNSIVMRPHQSEDADMNVDQFIGVNLIHRGNLVVLNTLVKAAIARSLCASAEIINKMLKAAHEELPSILSVIDGLAKKYNWTEPVRDNVVLGTENKSTRAALVNGVTFAAREMADPDASADMSALGGAILVAPESLFARAAKLAARREVEDLVLVER